MNASSPGSTGPTAATPETLAREAQHLEGSVATLRGQTSFGRWLLSIATLLIIIQFAVFCWALFHKIRGNFAQEAVQRAVSERGDAIVPIASSLLIETGRNIMPDYRKAINASLHARGPTMAKAAIQRFEQVPEQSGKLMQEKLQKTFDEVIKKIEPDFKAAFPNLSDEKRQQLVSDFLKEQIDTQNKRIAERVNQVYANDLIHMQSVLEKFNLPDGTIVNADQTERDFLHTMVSLLDDQLDAAYGKDGSVMTASATASGTTISAAATEPTTAPAQ